MHSLTHIGMGIILLIACGLITARFFRFGSTAGFSWSFTIARDRFFWLGVAVGIVFLWSDFRFEHYFSLLPH